MGDGSLGYASRLSFRADLGGQLGDPELTDSDADCATKSAELADLIRSATHVIAFTGAGISTSAGIPDFRGPNGVWTKQRRGEEAPKASMPFSQARPSLTHQALLGLHRAKKLQYLCSQNVDCLHLRSGFPRSRLAELHGNCFVERCEGCKREYTRDFEIESVGFKLTGRRCTGCNGALRDHCLDWDDPLPEEELSTTEREAAKADLAICLGTSLQITPACDLPLRVRRKQRHKPQGGKLVIINLQRTPKDGKASLVIHRKADEVMRRVMQTLQIPIPPYVRRDAFLVSHELRSRHGVTIGDADSGLDLVVKLRSVHGAECPLTWLASCDAELVVNGHTSPGKDPSSVDASLGTSHTANVRLAERSRATGKPWEMVLKPGELHVLSVLSVLLTLHFVPGCTEGPTQVKYDADCAMGRRATRAEATRMEVITCRLSYDEDESGRKSKRPERPEDDPNQQKIPRSR
ncbi:hypothetical protein AB1Y20_002283 [Prymnesium parvum]|uniref:protein acetyllysine N-acetyltransferase n=1 Tax=Prymnesium parvum TaxID=97485 RepID=A0AB34J8Y5_PRYPA